jgi:uncharacterized membrane protein
VASFTLLDLLALLVFALCWLGYPAVVDRVPAIRARSVLAAMDVARRRWMHAAQPRENRIPDIAAIGNLLQTTSFLATTVIFVLGGLVAMLGAADIGQRVVAVLPWAESGDQASWEAKIGLLLVIFVNAFFELTWALRQFNYGSILLGAIPVTAPEAPMTREAETAAAVLNRAAEHFTSGLRAYYFGLAALAWILHPLALMAASLWVLRELHRREFRSAIRAALRR